MVRRRGNAAKNQPPNGEAATSQKLYEILSSLLDTIDHLVVLEQQVMGNEGEEEDSGNNNQSQLVDNTNVGNLGIDNNNTAHAPDHPENKKERLAAKLTNDYKRISPPKFDCTTLGDGAENWLSEMEKYFKIRNFLEETK
ncbi:hypothetical protein KI387_040620, partial [Taxus chinensis]